MKWAPCLIILAFAISCSNPAPVIIVVTATPNSLVTPVPIEAPIPAATRAVLLAPEHTSQPFIAPNRTTPIATITTVSEANMAIDFVNKGLQLTKNEYPFVNFECVVQQPTPNSAKGACGGEGTRPDNSTSIVVLITVETDNTGANGDFYVLMYDTSLMGDMGILTHCVIRTEKCKEEIVTVLEAILQLALEGLAWGLTGNP